jgi:hypothetical protein
MESEPKTNFNAHGLKTLIFDQVGYRLSGGE